MRILLFLAILLSLLCGCTQTIPAKLPNHTYQYYISIDYNFDSSEKDIIKQSLNEWQEGSYNIFSWYPLETRFLISYCDPILQFKKRSSSEEEVIAKTKYYGPFLKGWIDKPLDPCEPRTIHLIADKLDSPKLYKVVTMHEIGHSLGQPHNKRPDSIMNSEVALSFDKPTHTDIQLFFKSLQ